MLIQLAIIGIVVALLPLTMVWVSSDSNKYRKLVWVTVFLTFDLIMFGAFTRLTDSGLGCPDWPGCYGHANPLQAHEHISAAEAAMPDGPVTVVKAWIEMIHRYLAMAVGVLIMSMTAIAWRMWLRSSRRDIGFTPWMPTMLLGFVCLQGAFGAWTVTLKLQPVIVTIHLLLGMALLGMLGWLAARQDSRFAVEIPTPPSFRQPAALALALLFVQIALGGWVSTNYAALACSDFPLCHGQLVPAMDFSNGFALWRELGKTASGEYLPFPALTAIHWVHRMFALVVVLFVLWLSYRVGKTHGLKRTARWLRVAVAVQFITGMSTVYLEWPLALAVLHNGGAAVLVLLLTILNFQVRHLSQTAMHRAVTRLSAA
ncbi:COX15/CtaA family protein [Noviherbaspirillum agri]